MEKDQLLLQIGHGGQKDLLGELCVIAMSCLNKDARKEAN